MSKKFLLLGKDARQKYLKQILEKQGYSADYQETVKTIDIRNYDVILLPVPDSPAFFDKIKDDLSSEQIVFGCNIKSRLQTEVAAAEAEMDKDKRVRIVEYMKSDRVAVKNAVATAEGAIAEAVIHSDGNLCGSECLVLGYGRCGKVIADRVRAMKANTSVLERKAQECAMAQAVGIRTFDFKDKNFFKEQGKNFDYIFNTIPALVLQEKELACLKPTVTIIDIASKPGGVDFEYCSKHGINAHHVLGIPGKYSPKTSAEILMEVIAQEI